MSCSKRPFKLFGLIGSFRDHDWQIDHVGVFMYGISEHFTVTYKCSCCDITKKDHFVEAEKLMRNGYSAEQLKVIRGY